MYGILFLLTYILGQTEKLFFFQVRKSPIMNFDIKYIFGNKKKTVFVIYSNLTLINFFF